jgi:hypothetical protein
MKNVVAFEGETLLTSRSSFFQRLMYRSWTKPPMRKAGIRERVSQVKADQKARGRFPGGSVQFGYRITDDGALVPHEPEQEAIREMTALKAQGRSLRAISAEMQAGRAVGSATWLFRPR